jgi:hypothetical protein
VDDTMFDSSCALRPSLCALVFAAIVKLSPFAGAPLRVTVTPFIAPEGGGVAGIVAGLLIVIVIVAPFAAEYGTTCPTVKESPLAGAPEIATLIPPSVIDWPGGV